MKYFRPKVLKKGKLSETQAEQQKRTSKKALDLNGGNDEAHHTFGTLCLRIQAQSPHYVLSFRFVIK
jgi:hypothetical protein